MKIPRHWSMIFSLGCALGAFLTGKSPDIWIFSFLIFDTKES